MTRRRAAFGLTILGLVVVARGVIDAQPLVFAYTDQEYAEARTGRVIMVAGTMIVLAAAAALAADGARWRAGLVALPGVACTGLALAVPPYRGGLALVLFVPLGMIALAAAYPRGSR